MSDNISIALPATALANSWLRVSHAQSSDAKRPGLCQTVAMEVHERRGVRLVATDGYILLHRWVGIPDSTGLLGNEPDIDEAPAQTVVAMDIDGRGRSLMAFLQRNYKDEPEIEVLVQTGAGLLPDDTDEPTLSPDLDRIGCAFTSPGERLVLPVFDGVWLNWRTLVKSRVERGTDRIGFNADVAKRVASAHVGCSFEILFAGASAMMRTESLMIDPPLHGFVMPIRLEDMRPANPSAVEDEPDPDQGVILEGGEAGYGDNQDAPTPDKPTVAETLAAFLATAHDLDAPTAAQTLESLEAEDDLLRHAIDLVVSSQKVSSAMLSSKLKVGPARAKKLIALMERCHVVGPNPNGRGRVVLVREMPK